LRDTNKYSYVKNLQGDVVAIINAMGGTVVEYKYDAWGNILSVTGSMSATLGAINPFRYRGCYYDTESGFYYLQSRYYDPQVGRFLNADSYVSTGQGILGHNMFA
jgi:RHS repeat-associated protein